MQIDWIKLYLFQPIQKCEKRDKGLLDFVYALVSRGKTVLAEFTASSGNFPTVTRVLLAKIPTEDSKMSYVYDQHIFHYVVQDGITYLCMADNDFKRRVPFQFLEDLKVISAYLLIL
ncbi:hypothetical protein DYB35_012865 [Aphanomyces astaci]|uniref:Longin domain-containing protein n=2 Tax=Aphanomyces astaci TaxID=112090 RepID=A0A3R6ZKS6_APHAT|nr:hypothetical protein DYB35_012865 [Aphanomyces astaci]